MKPAHQTTAWRAEFCVNNGDGYDFDEEVENDDDEGH